MHRRWELLKKHGLFFVMGSCLAVSCTCVVVLSREGRASYRVRAVAQGAWMRTALSGTTLCSSSCAATMARPSSSAAAARRRPATSATAPCGWPLTTQVHHPVPRFLLPDRVLHRDTCALWQQVDMRCRTALLSLMSLGVCAMCSARRGRRRAGVAAGGAQRERARQRRRRVRARAGALDHAVPAARGALAHGRAPTSTSLLYTHFGALWSVDACLVYVCTCLVLACFIHARRALRLPLSRCCGCCRDPRRSLRRRLAHGSQQPAAPMQASRCDPA